MEPEKGPYEHLGPTKLFLDNILLAGYFKLSQRCQSRTCGVTQQPAGSTHNMTHYSLLYKKRREKNYKAFLAHRCFLSSVSRCCQY
jgi:hypothetical protein